MTSAPALEDLRRAATSGAPDALYALAKRLIADSEPEQAFAPVSTAAQAGHPGAQVELARMYLYGVGAPPDVAQSVEWLQRAERAAHPGASYLLALIALGGIAVERDLEATARRLLTAAKAGLVPAVRALAMHFGRDRTNVAAMRQSEALLAQGAAQHDGVCAALLAERVRHGELVGDVRYALDGLDRVARNAGIRSMPALPASPVVPGPDNRLQLDLEANLRAPTFVACSRAPRIAIVDGLLSTEDCRYIIAMGMPHLIRSRVADPHSDGWMQHPGRTSDDTAFDALLEDFHLRLLQLRMAGAIGMDFTCAEPMVMLHYGPGQEYFPHRDYLPPETLAANQPEAGQRAITLLCYLSEVEAGGQTIFPKPNSIVTPAAGRAVAFWNLDDNGRPDPDTLHAGLPVQSGEKWLATLWLRERRHRSF